MSSSQIFNDLAEAYTREILATFTSFQTLGPEEQKALCRDLYRALYDELVRQSGRAGGTVSRALARSDQASDRIDDSRHKNQRSEQAEGLAGELIDEVDFPGFVRDLLKGVFDANLEATLAQMSSYQDLLEAATASIGKFVNAIDDAAAFGYLAENNSDEFGIDLRDETLQDGTPRAVLTDPNGEPVDLGDNQVKAKIVEAKTAMAREKRALLRETILMGIARLVVKRGAPDLCT